MSFRALRSDLVWLASASFSPSETSEYLLKIAASQPPVELCLCSDQGTECSKQASDYWWLNQAFQERLPDHGNVSGIPGTIPAVISEGMAVIWARLLNVHPLRGLFRHTHTHTHIHTHTHTYNHISHTNVSHGLGRVCVIGIKCVCVCVCVWERVCIFVFNIVRFKLCI